jgi:hypothetical protein
MANNIECLSVYFVNADKTIACVDIKQGNQKLAYTIDASGGDSTVVYSLNAVNQPVLVTLANDIIDAINLYLEGIGDPTRYKNIPEPMIFTEQSFIDLLKKHIDDDTIVYDDDIDAIKCVCNEKEAYLRVYPIEIQWISPELDVIYNVESNKEWFVYANDEATYKAMIELENAKAAQALRRFA